MRKRKQKKRKAIRISPQTTLRPRLDNLWGDGVLLHKHDEAIEGDLDVIARDVAADFLVKTMLRAYLSASALLEPIRAQRQATGKGNGKGKKVRQMHLPTM